MLPWTLYICDALRDLVSVTIWRLHDRSNAYECMLPFAWVSMAFEQVYQMTNVWRPFKRVNTSNLMTFKCCFLISWYRENCNAMSSFTTLGQVPWNTFICSAVQCFHWFVMVFINCLLSFFSDAAYNDQSQFVEIVVERSVFECNIQKIVPRSVRLKKYVIFKNRNM